MLLPFATVELLQRPMPRPTLGAWLGALFLAAVVRHGLRVQSGAARAGCEPGGCYFTLDPIVRVATAIVFLGEVLRGGQVVGGVMALVGMWLAASSPVSNPIDRPKVNRSHCERGLR
jgi:hypothetical protein